MNSAESPLQNEVGLTGIDKQIAKVLEEHDDGIDTAGRIAELLNAPLDVAIYEMHRVLGLMKRFEEANLLNSTSDYEDISSNRERVEYTDDDLPEAS